MGCTMVCDPSETPRDLRTYHVVLTDMRTLLRISPRFLIM